MKFTRGIRPLVLVAALAGLGAEAQVIWLVNNTTNIGGVPAIRIGNPQVISTPYGNAVWFDGANDGLKLATNPIAGLTHFTVEMIFRPDASTHASSTQPRIFHIQSPNPPDHRLTLEARIINGLWYGDTFLRSSVANSLTLSDPAKTHSVAEWYQLAVTYDGARFQQYVNTTLELSGALSATALTNGECSIGMRATTNEFFEGAVLALRFSGRVLATNEFLCLPQTVLSAPVLSGGEAHVDFRLASGLPLRFTLEQTDRIDGPWRAVTDALLATNVPGISYRFTLPTNGPTEFYRVGSP